MDSVPDVIVLEELVAPQLEDRLIDNFLDLGLRGYVDEEPSEVRGLRHEALGISPFPLVIHATNELRRTKQPLKLSKLISQRFVLIRAKRHRQTLDEYFDRNDFKPTVVAEASTVADVLSLVRAREELVTVVALPTPHLTNLNGLAMVQIAEAPLQKSFLLRPARDMRGKAAKRYVDALKECFLCPGA